MDGPGHYRKAEELAAEACKLLGRGDGQATAAGWAAAAQIHATLALAAAAALPDTEGWRNVLVKPAPPHQPGQRADGRGEQSAQPRSTLPPGSLAPRLAP